MRAGISSEKSSSRRSGIRQLFVTTVAQRLVRGALAGAEPYFFARLRLPFLRAEFGALVRAVTKWLRLRTSAGAPPIALAGLDLDRDRLPSTDLWHFAHLSSPHPLI